MNFSLPPAREIGARIRAARTAAGITQQDMARRIGMRGGPLCNIELGKNRPSLHALAGIAAQTGHTLDELAFGGSDHIAKLRAERDAARADLEQCRRELASVRARISDAIQTLAD